MTNEETHLMATDNDPEMQTILPTATGPVVVAMHPEDNEFFDAVPSGHPSHPSQKAGVLSMCCVQHVKDPNATVMQQVGHGRGEYIEVMETRTRYKYVGAGKGSHQKTEAAEVAVGESSGCCRILCYLSCLLGLAAFGVAGYRFYRIIWGADYVATEFVVTQIMYDELSKNSTMVEKFKLDASRALALEASVKPADVEVHLSKQTTLDDPTAPGTQVRAQIRPKSSIDLQDIKRNLVESRTLAYALVSALKLIDGLKEVTGDYMNICIAVFSARVVSKDPKADTTPMTPTTSQLCPFGSPSPAVISNGRLPPVAPVV